VHDINVICSGN